jgi:hypothetical protein
MDCPGLNRDSFTFTKKRIDTGKFLVYLALKYVTITQNTYMSNYVPHFHGVAQALADIFKKFPDVNKDKFCQKAYNHMITNTLGRITQ